MNASRILHVAPTPFFSDRGCHIRILGLIKALQQKGYESLVCTYPIGRDLEGIRAVRTVSVPGYTMTEAGPSGFKYIADALLIVKVWRMIRKFRPAILHCHLHEGALIGWLAKWLALRPALPIVFDMQGSLTDELAAHGYFNRLPAFASFFEWVERQIVRTADFSICSSTAAAQLLREAYGVDGSRIAVVPDGANVVGHRVSNPEMANARANAISTAIYSGGLSGPKGLESLKEIILEANRRGLPVHFLIVGYPTEDLADFVKEKNLEHSCTMTGQVPFERLVGYLESANVALEPKSARSKEASGKVLNYMAAGLPVICFDTSINRELLADHGYYSARMDVQSFVDRLAEAVANGERARAAGLAGRKRVEEKFGWESSADKVLLAYSAASKVRRMRRRDRGRTERL